MGTTHGKIMTADEAFKLGDWGNANIHDTHLRSSPRDLMFPADFPRPEMLGGVLKQISAIERAVEPLCREHKPYAGEKASYQIFGVDLMVRRDGRVVLIEINEKPGFDFLDLLAACRDKFFDLHYEWVWKNIKGIMS